MLQLKDKNEASYFYAEGPKMILGVHWGARARSLAIPHQACSVLLDYSDVH